jgi:hypothetical protein
MNPNGAATDKLGASFVGLTLPAQLGSILIETSPLFPLRALCKKMVSPWNQVATRDANA